MGNRFYDRDTFLQFASVDETAQIDHIPAMVYTITLHPELGPLLLKNRMRFSIPERKYGYHSKYYNTISASYDPLMPATGLIGDGLKGSGKSMLAEDLGNYFISRGLPVLMIDQKLPWQVIRNVVAAIGPCCVYFDEFGKVYNKREDRASMLPLFSDSEFRGVFWIVTSNDPGELSEYMIDRPGRFLWRISYNYIPVAMGLEIARDLHVPEELLPAIGLYVHTYTVSFDVVRRLCLTAATCKTLEELADKVEILNIPKLAYRSYTLNEVLYKGNKLYVNSLTAKVVDNVIELKILDKSGEVIDTLSFDGMDERAIRANQSEEDVKALGVRTESDSELTGSGNFILKVSDVLSVKFNRHSTQRPNAVYLGMGFDPETQPSSLGWSLSQVLNGPSPAEEPPHGKVEGSEEIAAIRQAEEDEAEKEELEAMIRALDEEIEKASDEEGRNSLKEPHTSLRSIHPVERKNQE